MDEKGKSVVDRPAVVTLESSDGFKFIIDRKYAMVSGTIKNMLSAPGTFTEAQNNKIDFRDVKAVILEKVCQYFYYNVRNANNPGETPEFEIEAEYALELLLAANFLDS